MPEEPEKRQASQDHEAKELTLKTIRPAVLKPLPPRPDAVAFKGNVGEKTMTSPACGPF